MLVSIITINLNNVKGLEKTIKSVADQSNKNFEYIVIDGNSIDGSQQLLVQYNQYIDRSFSESDTGIYNAMNKGVKYATGDYCLFLNSGDILADKDVIDNLYKKELQAEIITGDTILFPGEEIWKSPETVSLLTFFKGSLSHQSTLIKKELLIKYPYDETKKIVSDWKFCIETLVVHNYSYQRYDGVISKYDKTGISSSPENFKKADNEKLEALRELLPPRIILDYDSLINGETPFEKLILRISRNPKYSQLLYNILSPLTNIYCNFFKKKL